MSVSDELARRFGAITAEQVGALDAAAARSGVEVLQLMEIAGFQVARSAWDMLGGSPAAVCVVAGRGNNGGDGLVAARLLATWGCDVSVLVLTDDRDPVAVITRHVSSATACGVSVRLLDDEVGGAEVSAAALPDAALCIDAILGTGLRSDPRGVARSAIDLINRTDAPVLAVDVPSGFDATTGRAYEPCVTARRTCTLAAVKAGMWQPEAAKRLGQLVVADIGMAAAAWRAAGLEPPTDVRGGALLPVPTSTRQ